jgi:hypothetical protein
MSIGVLLRGFIGDMMDFGDVILYTLFPSFMTIQACSWRKKADHQKGYPTSKLALFLANL